jgi:hypothetical protein
MRRALLPILLGLLPATAYAQLTAQTPTTPGTPTLVTTAPGSSDTVDEIRTQYHVHLGPLYMNPALLLKELGVDTNVFNAAGDQKSDFTFTITPKADVALPFGHRGLLRTTAALDVVYYAHYASERSLDPQVMVRAEGYASRVTFFGQGAYLNTRQRPNYEIDLRSRHVESGVTAGVGVRATTRLSVELSANAQTIRYDADAFLLGSSLRDTLNQNESGWRVIARERLSSLTTVAVRYDNEQDRFPYSPVRDNNSYRVMPGVEFKPKALIAGSAYVGYRRLTPKTDQLPEYQGPVAQLALSYTLLGATMFGVTYDRDVAYSYEAINPYYLDNSLGVFIRRAMGGRFDVIVSAARHNYDYRDLQALAAALPPRVDRTDDYSASLGYRMKGNTRLGLGAAYYTRDSTRETFRQYDGLRAGLTVTYGF